MNALQRQMLARLEQLRDGSTICPGQLARECGTTLRDCRPDLLSLARSGKIKLSQKGRPAQPQTMRGPFRVRLS